MMSLENQVRDYEAQLLKNAEKNAGDLRELKAKVEDFAQTLLSAFSTSGAQAITNRSESNVRILGAFSMLLLDFDERFPGVLAVGLNPGEYDNFMKSLRTMGDLLVLRSIAERSKGDA